jgi:hypothetical protein
VTSNSSRCGESVTGRHGQVRQRHGVVHRSFGLASAFLKARSILSIRWSHRDLCRPQTGPNRTLDGSGGGSRKQRCGWELWRGGGKPDFSWKSDLVRFDEMSLY